MRHFGIVGIRCRKGLSVPLLSGSGSGSPGRASVAGRIDHYRHIFAVNLSASFRAFINVFLRAFNGPRENQRRDYGDRFAMPYLEPGSANSRALIKIRRLENEEPV